MSPTRIAHNKSHADHRDKSCDAVPYQAYGYLDVEGRKISMALSRFLSPIVFVCQNRLSLGRIEAYENLQFRTTSEVFDPEVPAR